jgi:hypothetical protein
MSETYIKQGNELVEKILIDDKLDLEKEIVNSLNIKEKRKYYLHISNLFLNALLNRLTELGEYKKERILEAMKICKQQI